jgi:GTPase SAR1 family protein
MSSSSSHHHHEEQRHRRRRRHRHDHTLLPELIDIGSQQSHTLNEEPENEQETKIDWNVFPKKRGNVRIVVPSSCIPPDPPEESPPRPLEMLKLLVLGEQGSGKSSIVRRFVHRATIHPDGANAAVRSSASKSSTKSKQPAEQQRKAGSWTVDYYKKDVSFWNSAKTSRCVRVQLWDVGGRSPAAYYVPSSAPITAASKGNNPEVMQLLQRSKAVILVISLDQGPRHALTEARKWKRWLTDMHIDNNDQETKPVYWFLHKSDVIPHQEEDTNNMLQLGAVIADTSHNLCFADWHLTTCEHEDGASVEEAIMKVIRANVEELSHVQPSTASSVVPSLATNTVVSE